MKGHSLIGQVQIFFNGYQQLYKRCALCLLLCSSFATLQRTAEEWLKRSAKKGLVVGLVKLVKS